MDFRIG